jgi:hypothetical protein
MVWKLDFDGFSVHSYDKDGDIHDPGIYLHFGSVRVKVAETLDQFAVYGGRLERCEKEIRENYDDV